MLEKVLQKLHGVTKNGNGHKALCPSHADKNPSLSVGLSDSGNVLLHCHAGCEKQSILDAAGLTMNDLFPEKRTTQKSRIVATYDYRDEVGNLLFQTVRYEPKDFKQRRLNGDRWVWNLRETRRVPYRLPELLKADKTLPVFIVEGEKDVESLRSIGQIATCNPLGAGKWKSEYNDFLKDRRCVILPDNNKPGEEHANAVIRNLTGIATETVILRLPGLSEDVKDVSDWLAQGNTLDELYALLAGTGENADTAADKAVRRSIRKEVSVKTPVPARGETQSSRLMALADEEGVELFHTAEHEGFATFSDGSHKETYPIRSRAFKDWLALQYWKAENAVPSSQAMQDVVTGLGGRARFDGAMRAVHLRVAEHDGDLYLDLGNERWQIVKITKDGWEILDDSPVRFRRKNGCLALPVPEKGGAIEDLRKFANVSDDDWPLLLSWLVTVFRPGKPFPVLVLHGEQGSGKSTTAKVLRSLIDPNKSSLRSSPKDERDLMIAASNSWVVSLDNLSSMSVTLSDSLCRLSTGGGFSTRELYSDGEEVLLDVMRPVILNGIDEVISRSDLLDRALLLQLPRLQRHFDETTFWKEFELVKPKLLGSILDAVCVALSQIETVTATARLNDTDLPRLADFTLWGIAAETGFGLPPGQFFERYKGNRDAVHNLVLDCDPFAEALLTFMRHKTAWAGTPSELLQEIRSITNDSITRSRGFPQNAKGVGRRLQILAQNLRAHGVDFTPPNRNKRGRHLTLRRVNEAESDNAETLDV